MKKIIFISLFLSSSVFAEPEDIDIVGLVPGISSVADFDAISKETVNSYANTANQKNGSFEIGGYKLPCIGNFSNGVLERFVCFTGNKFTYDHSNVEIHDVLKRGFAKKFGSPTNDSDTPTRTRIGVEYNQNITTWIDKKGNDLVLYSMMGKIDEGALIMTSYSKRMTDRNKNIQQDKERKF